MIKRSNKRLFTSFLAVLLLCICSFGSRPVHAFLDEQEIAECEEDLGEADANVDGNLDEDEYLAAIRLRSGGLLEFTSYEDLPISFVSTFLFSACTGRNCRRAPPVIPITDSGVTAFFCFNLANAIASSLRPTVVPGTPTSPPTDSPTPSPTVRATPSPTVRATPSPTKVPTIAPTVPLTPAPTRKPTPAPTPLPSIETPMPTPEALICVTFQYGVSNNNGFSAEDLFNENGNTFKTGLLVATETVLINVLNATSTGSRQLRGVEEDHPSGHIRPVMQEMSQRRAASMDRISSYSNSMGRRRKLVFYSDEWPVTIDAIIPNPFSCPTNSDCAVVSSTVCVLLEEGENEVSIREFVLDGIETAIESGAFEAAVPPENQFS